MMCSPGGAGSTFLSVLPPHRDVGGDEELCALGRGAAVVHQWHQHGCHTAKRAETGYSSDRSVFPLAISGFAETASAHEQMSLGDVVIIPIYPHALLAGDTALFMGLFVNDKVTLTVINLVFLGVSRII